MSEGRLRPVGRVEHVSWLRLAITLLTTLALSMAAASAAEARSALFKADTDGGMNVSASLSFNFVTSNGEMECEGSSASDPGLEREARSVQMPNPSNGECFLFGQEAEIAPNGCGYEFHAGAYTSGGKSSGVLDIDCPSGKELEFKTVVDSSWCTFYLPPQKGLTGASFSSQAGEPDTVSVALNISGVKYSSKGLLCGTGTGQGVLTGNASLTAATDDETENEVPLSIVEEPLMAFQAEAEGVADFTTTSSNQIFNTYNGEFDCGPLAASGEISSETELATSSIASGNSCGFFGSSSEIIYNGCDFVYSVGVWDGVGKSVGTADIECEHSSEAIEVPVYGTIMCTYRFEEGSGLGVIRYATDQATGTVKASIALNGLSYSYSGYTCAESELNDGEYVAEATISASSEGEPVPIAVVPVS